MVKNTTYWMPDYGSEKEGYTHEEMPSVDGLNEEVDSRIDEKKQN